jgi:DNA repair protein RadC
MIVATARTAADLLAPVFAEADGERIAVLHLDRERRMIGLDGYPAQADAAELPLRAIVAAALARGTTGMVIAHNHPSGDPTPSQADVETTRLLSGTVAALGIRLHDHLVFAGHDCRSFRAAGLL